MVDNRLTVRQLCACGLSSHRHWWELLKSTLQWRVCCRVQGSCSCWPTSGRQAWTQLLTTVLTALSPVPTISGQTWRQTQPPVGQSSSGEALVASHDGSLHNQGAREQTAYIRVTTLRTQQTKLTGQCNNCWPCTPLCGVVCAQMCGHTAVLGLLRHYDHCPTSVFVWTHTGGLAGTGPGQLEGTREGPKAPPEVAAQWPAAPQQQAWKCGAGQATSTSPCTNSRMHCLLLVPLDLCWPNSTRVGEAEMAQTLGIEGSMHHGRAWPSGGDCATYPQQHQLLLQRTIRSCPGDISSIWTSRYHAGHLL